MIWKIEFERLLSGRWFWAVYSEKDPKHPARKSWEDFPTFPDAQRDLAAKIREDAYEFSKRIGGVKA